MTIWSQNSQRLKAKARLDDYDGAAADLGDHISDWLDETDGLDAFFADAIERMLAKYLVSTEFGFTLWLGDPYPLTLNVHTEGNSEGPRFDVLRLISEWSLWTDSLTEAEAENARAMAQSLREWADKIEANLATDEEAADDAHETR